MFTGKDECTLFIKNLPIDCTVKEIQALSKDIKEVRLRIQPNYGRGKKEKKSGYVFMTR